VRLIRVTGGALHRASSYHQTDESNEKEVLMSRLLILSFVWLLFVGCRYYFHDPFSTDDYFDPGWRQFDEGRPDRYEIRDGWLRITASRGEDLWGGMPRKRGAPLLLHTAPSGDYEVECIVDARWGPDTPQYINTQVGLFVFQDLQNWLFFGFTYHSHTPGPLPEGDGLIVTAVREDVAEIEEYNNFAPDNATLKIVKSGNWWRFYFKRNGSWHQVGSQVFATFGAHEVGLGVKSFVGSGSAQRGSFDDFIIRGC